MNRNIAGSHADSPQAMAEHTVDMIGNIEALLRDEDDYEDADAPFRGTHVANANHFFVVSTPSTPVNPNPSAVIGAGLFGPAVGGYTPSSASSNNNNNTLHNKNNINTTHNTSISNTNQQQSTTKLTLLRSTNNSNAASALNSTMNTGAAPFRPRGPAGGGDLFSAAAMGGVVGAPTTTTTTFTPYAPVHLSLATPPRTSSLRDAARPGFITFEALRTYTTTHYAVIVNNLDPRTQSKHLMSIFFPLGAVDALAFQSPVGCEAMGAQFAGRKGGIVLFTSSEMAVMAAHKIDDFVPHGQTLPLHTTYFGRYDDYLANKDTFTMTRQPGAASAIPSHLSAGHMSCTNTTSHTNGDAQQWEGNNSANPPTSPTQANPTAGFVALFTKAASISTEECDKALEALLSRFTKDPSPRNTELLAAVVAALQAQSDPNLTPSSAAYEGEAGAPSPTSSPFLPHAQHFLRSLSRFVIQTGIMDHTTNKALKAAAGHLCGVMFAVGVVRGNPYGMGLRILRELVLKEDAGAGSGPLGEAQSNTLDALIMMGSSWHSNSNDAATAAKADVEAEFEAICAALVAEGRYTMPRVANTPPPLSTPAPIQATANDMSVLSDTDGPACGSTAPASVTGNANDISAIAVVDAINTSTATDAGGNAVSKSSFLVSSSSTAPTPLRSGPTHLHTSGATTTNMSVESNASSVGPTSLNTSHQRYGATTSSMLNTPEKMAAPSALAAAARFGDPLAVHAVPHGVLGRHAFPAAAPLPPGLLGSAHQHHNPLMMQAGVAGTSATSGGVHTATPMGATGSALLSAASGAEGSNLRHHLMASTVYMTKVPLTLAHATLRKLFDCFGEYNKVRIYEEKKAGSSMNVNMRGGPQNGVAPLAFNNRGNFGFVEFVIPASSKAMVDFFRNPNTSVQQRMGISKSDMEAILSMRVSYARSCIHDHDQHDALFDQSDVSPMDVDCPGRKVKPCTFGLE